MPSIKTFRNLDPEDLEKKLLAKSDEVPVNIIHRTKSHIEAMLNALARDGDLKLMERRLEIGLPLSVMSLIEDDRFFNSFERGHIQMIYRRHNEYMAALLDKDIREIVKGDQTFFEHHFAESPSTILPKIYAMRAVIKEIGLPEAAALPRIYDELAKLDPKSVKAVLRIAKILATKPYVRSRYTATSESTRKLKPPRPKSSKKSKSKKPSP